MPVGRAKKVQIVNEQGTQAARVTSGQLVTTPGSSQASTARARKVIIVDPVTGEPASVVLGALVTT